MEEPRQRYSVYKTKGDQISSPRFSVSDREWSCSGLIKSILFSSTLVCKWSFAHDELLAITYHLLFLKKRWRGGRDIVEDKVQRRIPYITHNNPPAMIISPSLTNDQSSMSEVKSEEHLQLDELDYSPKDEARAVRKVDFLVLPVIVFCFLMLQFVSAIVFTLTVVRNISVLIYNVGSHQFR